MIEFRDDAANWERNSVRLMPQRYPDREEVREAMRKLLTMHLPRMRREFDEIPPDDLEIMAQHPYMYLRVLHAHLYGSDASV